MERRPFGDKSGFPILGRFSPASSTALTSWPPFRKPAAHLLSWSEFRNDHPTNGLALCKNHHWAMDRNLIAPTPDHDWKVASILDARRSTGEAELLGLHGKSVLLPKDRAFHPDPAGLAWRLNRLCARIVFGDSSPYPASTPNSGKASITVSRTRSDGLMGEVVKSPPPPPPTPRPALRQASRGGSRGPGPRGKAR
jgi:hypothetical protein